MHAWALTIREDRTQAIRNDAGHFSLEGCSEGDHSLVASAFRYRSARSEVVHLVTGEAKIVKLRMNTRAFPLALLIGLRWQA